MSITIKVRAFIAPEDPEACMRFYEGHSKLLEIHFGIAKITSGNVDWLQHRNTIVVIVEDETGEKTYGGARVQLADGVIPLPIETAIGKYDPKIYTDVRKGSAEICGMWNSKEVAGMGIGSLILSRVCVALMTQLPVDRVHVLCAPITTRMARRVGAVIDTSLGNEGTFYYPKDDFIATAMVINDLHVLQTADESEKTLIRELRRQPNQTRTETGPKGIFEVAYQLEVDYTPEDETAVDVQNEVIEKKDS
ncbi:hypothetical protein MKQ68_25000 [Chitinophaga horti]|uniref:N-acetyltransferase domain-containing protein n=1 Tax=Chitinophaga horti TaxID=2920382 RepID=A0ABY6J134_9BACT|nr:hypothetical protein [Chitinophaga horti]UYQ93345.1 hypothetical protein MKQ68_25000 [Chitinophaga horti]